MGYTHYWYRKESTFDLSTFRNFAEDCKKVCVAAEIPLAGMNGRGEPVFSDDEVGFNGREDCGHTERDLGITWPAPDAKGGASPDGEVTGQWFAGAQLERRTCDGDCSHESFGIRRWLGDDGYKGDNGEFFDFCKTAYKPYDIPVTACLIIAEHHFGDAIRVSSDGEERDWEDARRLCQHVLGYGKDFRIDKDSEEQAEAV